MTGAIPIEEIRAAREVLAGTATRTPLVRLQVDAPAEIHLKLENLQPIGSFKIRGAFNAMSKRSPEELAAGVITASAGNMAQGVAWAARLRGIPCTVVVPDYAPKTKIAAIERLGGRVIPVPFADWWRAIEESRFPGLDGVFIHPVLDDAVMAGNGTIGLELLEDLPDLDGGRDPLGRRRAHVRHRERAPGAPSRGADLLGRAGDRRADGRVARRRRGARRSTTTARRSSTAREARRCLPKMWGLGRGLVDGGLVASLDETAAAVRMLAERARVVAEGAGALALAAALAGRAGGGQVACIVSGGNIDSERLRSDSLRRYPFLDEREPAGAWALDAASSGDHNRENF